MVKKALKITGLLAGVLLIVGLVLYLVYHEKEPTGIPGPEAEALTDNMLDAVNKKAWDTTRFVQWTFAGMHNYVWDKEKHLVDMRWSNKRVILNTRQISGEAFVDGKKVSDEESGDLVREAWSIFCNDSFWLNAPVKARDPGTERSIVTLKDGRKGLKVTYNEGGVTPGDSYVWLLDENGRPVSWKMWVKIIPIGGLEFSWDDWQQMQTGPWLSGLHKGLMDLEINNLKTAQNLQQLDMFENPFE